MTPHKTTPPNRHGQPLQKQQEIAKGYVCVCNMYFDVCEAA